MKVTDLDCSVQDALKKIIIDEGFGSNVTIEASKGSESGDGYASKTYAITLTGKGKKLEMFVKYFPIDNIQQKGIVSKLFKHEDRFYSEIYPVLKSFQAERNVEKPFNNVPKYFRAGTTRGIKPIVLENLRLQGYDLRDRRDRMDEEHLNLALEVFGKFHATGFALKDQEYETFQKITDGITDAMIEAVRESCFDKVLENCIHQFIENLHPVHDKDILKHTNGLAKYLMDNVVNITSHQGEYCTLLQGDCWSNNMMFLYKNSKKPLDIKLVDWQIIRVNYPVLDLSYFFYCVATPEMLRNWEHHMANYHKHFSDHCKKLGSDPDQLYPLGVLKDHWKEYSKYGFTFAFLLVKAMLYEKDEAPDLAKSLENSTIDPDLFNKKTRHQDVYDRRMKDIFRHFIENKFI